MTADGIDEVGLMNYFLTTKADGCDEVVLMRRQLLMALTKSIRFDDEGEWLQRSF